MTTKIPSILIVGGGAGGLELAVRLGNNLGKKKNAKVTLVNQTFVHVWKPLLHEIAAGTLDSHQDEINYFLLAKKHSFNFEPGRMIALNRASRTITIDSTIIQEKSADNNLRAISYDYLILATGSMSNDFNIPGVREHCFFLDTQEQAEFFHKQYLSHCLKAKHENGYQFNIVVIGGGATGVELISELHYATHELIHYGFTFDTRKNIHFTLIEAGKYILPFLSPQLSSRVSATLLQKGITILTSVKVIQSNEDSVITNYEKAIPATMQVWAGGIKNHLTMQQLDRLDTNNLGQLLVRTSLQTTLDDHVFAIGDCASCPQPNDLNTVPPRAQAARQQAQFLARYIPTLLSGRTIPPFIYKDYGSLVTIGHTWAIGQLMTSRYIRLNLEGRLARWFYYLLYKRHQATLFGWLQTCLLTLANLLSRPSRPRLKLH